MTHSKTFEVWFDDRDERCYTRAGDSVDIPGKEVKRDLMLHTVELT